MVDPVKQAYAIVILMLLTPWAAGDIATWQGPLNSPDDSSLEPSNSTYDGFILPSNTTITGSNFEVEPEWLPAADNGSYWATDSVGGFAVGDFDGTSYLTSDGELSLAPISTYGVMADFETSIPQFSTWSAHGDEIWMPVNLSNVSYGPSNATSGNYVAGTNGSIASGSQGFIRSQFWPIPTVLRYLNLSFDRWSSFDSDDTAELHYTVDNGQNWVTLDNLSGVSNNWTHEKYSLDLIAKNASSIGFRFYVNTSMNSADDIGLFIDSFNISNQGDPAGTWLHGNPSGQYSANADGSLIVPVDLSGLTSPLEFTYWANWDMQGGYADNMMVMISQDNGSTWDLMSPIPGIPGHGIASGANSYSQQSYGWREIQHPFPSWAGTSANASNTLLKFRIVTDGSTNYGGSAIDGWEGIMVDDLRVLSAVGTANMQTRLLENFTDNNSQYLDTATGIPNDWQYVTWEGHNGPWYSDDSFELVQQLPSGWRVDHIRGSSPWERGQIDNTNGDGPNSSSWPSGVKGMGINLDGEYTANVYTHLVSPKYYIPTGSTAKLSFKHWICTEFSWDGGAIFTSVDDGLTWQHFGDNITGFYDGVSQVNTNSPFYGKGIFDGSTVANGCGNSNSNHTFTRVSGDISDLAGHNVRIRFSFFSDTYVENDGWYIDDAGIVIDRYQENGTWVSPVIDADESGWARLSSLYDMPVGTNLTVDVLDVNDNIIIGHQDRTLPFDLNIAAWEYPQLKFRLKFSTTNESLTPRVQILHHGITEYINLDILKRIDPSLPLWIEDPTLALPTADTYTAEIISPAWRPYSDVGIECEGNVSASLSSVIHRIPILGVGTPLAHNPPQGSLIDEQECGSIITNSFGPAQATTLHLQIEPGEEFEWIKLEPTTLRAPLSPSIDLGSDGIIDWKWDGLFHHTTDLYSLEIDGIPSPLTEARGFNTTYSSSLEFSILLPARNVSDLSWDCEANLYCYNGGINFDTNGSEDPTMNETQVLVNNSGFSHLMTEYQFKFTANQATSFNLHSLNYVSGFNHSINFNTSLEDLMIENSNTTSKILVTISTQRGGIVFDGDIDHESSIVDAWVSLPAKTFRPGLIQSAISNHKTIANTPNLQSINLKISSSTNLADTIAEITLDNLENGGRFIQNSGVGVIALDTSNSTWDGENVTWSFESKWLLDDYSRLYWFAAATNLEDLVLGPVMGVSGSGQHAASTNDLEVISLKAWANNRTLHDIGHPLWPLNVKGGEEVIVEGEVRYSGLDGSNPLPGDVDVVISLYSPDNLIGNTSVEIDENGKFNTTLTTPNFGTMSGTELIIKPVLTRIGPESSSNSIDMTSPSQKVRFILDEINLEVVSLEITAPGGNQPADGHVWYPGQDIPLQLSIVDDNGLPSSMELFYNRSGRGWESIGFLTPLGATSATVDLPLIDEMSVPLPDQETGWIDVFIQGNDLSGNPLLNGGNSTQPYARIYVQPPYDTVLLGSSLGLDTVDDYLLPGNTHRFNFTVSDDNGINSFDRVRFVLSEAEDLCVIEWQPWNDQIAHDVGCYIKRPRIDFVQRLQVNTWDVKIDFELRWDVEEHLGYDGHMPSLKIWDGNGPFVAGFTSIDILSWEIHRGVDLRIIDVEDKVSPSGDFFNRVVYIHDQDMIDLHIMAYHMDYDIPAHNLPFSTYFTIEMIGNNNSDVFTDSFNSDGSSTLRIVVDSLFYGEQIKLLAKSGPIIGNQLSGDSIDIIVDKSDPTLSLSSGSLVIIDSDQLSEVAVDVTIHDDHGLNNDSITMYWSYVRKGLIIEDSSGSLTMPVKFKNVRSNLYSEVVNMSTLSDLQKGDLIFVWFEGYDASGREISGNGTSTVDPIQTIVRWIAYEPDITSVVATPYRPNVGDIVSIECSITNLGLLDGNSTLSLIDGNGKLIQKLNFTLLVDMTFTHTFEIEAWSDGDLGLKIELDGQEVLVPISNVDELKESTASSQTTLLGLAFLSVFIAGLLLIIANTRRSNHSTFDEEE